MSNFEESLQVALLGGATNSDIVGYFAAEGGSRGVPGSLGPNTKVRVKLALDIDGTDLTLTADHDVPYEVFQRLKTGTNTAKARLLPFATKKVPQKVPEPTRKRKAVDDPSWEPKRTVPSGGTRTFKTKLGTSGHRKYYQHGDVEVSWVDIVELAFKHLGPDSKLQPIYEWAAANIYTFVDDRKCSIDTLSNWEASIRQNRRKAKKPETAMEIIPVPAQPLPMTSNTPKVKSENLDKTQLNAEINVLPNSVFDDNYQPTLSYQGMVDDLVDDITHWSEGLEPTKIPIANSAYEEMAVPPKVEFESPEETYQIHFA